MTKDIRIDGLAPLIRKLDTLQKLEKIKPALRASAVHVKGKISKYPRSSEANVPNQRRWYERGYGSRWMRRDGSIGGKKTSETLGKRWAVREERGGMTQIIGNNASYAVFVQDKDEQAAFHALRGWSTAQQVAQDETPVVIRFVQDEIDKILNQP